MQREQFLKAIGKRLKELRGDRSQENISNELSKILGEKRTKEAYQHYEAGRRLLPSDVLWGLSQIYEVSTDWILSGKEKAGGKKQPEILPRFYKDTISMAEIVQSLPAEKKAAVNIILEAMRSMNKKG
ncbi:MAG: helix-turn-helix transcriptional regulator [Deltaproteobacteria bacterium]|nr:helix-turn-helix transcriptional regulator [Deltaproteobacteria bacterium]